MTPRLSRHLLLALLLAPLFAATASVPTLDRLFPNQAEIFAKRAGLIRLPLPPEVLAATRSDLSDLRVFDALGREVPYLVDGRRRSGEAVEATRSFESRVERLEREVEMRDPGPDIHREHYRIVAPPTETDVSAWTLVFEVKAARFARSVTLRTAARDPSADSHDAGAGAPLLREEAIFRLDPETRRLRIPLPPFRADTVDVDIVGEEGFFLEPHFSFESSRVFDELAESVVPLEELSREAHDGSTIVELSRPSGVVPDRIRIATDTGSFQRGVVVFDEQPGRTERRLGGGRVFRINALRGVQELELSVRAASGSTLRLEIEDADAPPLEGLRFSAVIRQPALVFELPALPAGQAAGARGLLRFGGGRAHRPRYQLQSLLLLAGRTLHGTQAEAASRLYDPAELALARLGPIQANPAFDASPALAFAMHAGAEIDGRAWSHRRSLRISDSTEGLSRLALAPEDAAHARADFADLRVVGDDSRQWPYLMQPAAVSRTLLLEPEAHQAKKKRSSYSLRPSVSPLAASRLTLQADAPFFDRAFRLYALDEDGDRHEIAEGRLVKDGRRPRPSKIHFPAQRLHGLVLEVEDGDDAPLVLEAAELRVWLPQLFLVAPAGHYWLLLGQPDAGAPRYEIERVRDVVLAVSSSDVQTETLQPNPAFSLAARLSAQGGSSSLLQTVLIWSVLVIAVAVLGVLTLRVVRREPPPAGGDQDGA